MQLARYLSLFAVLACFSLGSLNVLAGTAIEARIDDVFSDVVAWRRLIHQNPELSNQEFKTSALVARHLKSLGLEVRSGVGKTGVVGILKGAHKGPVIALRADMDALPILEETGLPFASKMTALWEGQEVPVMHACGHDAHTAMLMGAATVLSSLRDQLAGQIMFVFQPAEEGAPSGETGGAPLMLDEGIFSDPKPDAIVGLHVEPGPLGQIQTRPMGFLPSATSLRVELKGNQAHAARPWEGTDLINLSADIIKSISTLTARQYNIFDVPNVVTIASVNAGNRGNILPGSVQMLGTIRAYSNPRREALKTKVEEIIRLQSDIYGAKATITFEDVALVTYNDPDLLNRLAPALDKAAGDGGYDGHASLRGAAEDFSFFQAMIPGVYMILGATRDFDPTQRYASNHSNKFDIDEEVMRTGVAAHVWSALEFLGQGSQQDIR